MLNIIVLKLIFLIFMTILTFGIMSNMTVLKLNISFGKINQSFGTMSDMMVLKPRNMLFIKIIVFHKILKTLLYE